MRCPVEAQLGQGRTSEKGKLIGNSQGLNELCICNKLAICSFPQISQLHPQGDPSLERACGVGDGEQGCFFRKPNILPDKNVDHVHI